MSILYDIHSQIRRQCMQIVESIADVMQSDGELPTVGVKGIDSRSTR